MHCLGFLFVSINFACVFLEIVISSRITLKIHISGTDKDRIIIFQHFNQKLLFINSSEKSEKLFFPKSLLLPEPVSSVAGLTAWLTIIVNQAVGPATLETWVSSVAGLTAWLPS